MNTRVSMKALAIASFAVLAADGLEQRAVAAEDTYRVRELRDLTNRAGVGTVQANHLNNMSEIIGYSTDASGTLRPTFWNHFFPTNLYTAYNQQIASVKSINDRSELIKTGTISPDRFGVYILRRGKVEFPMYSGFELHGAGVVLNNRGEIAFHWFTGDTTADSYYWFNGVLRGVDGNDEENSAAAINNAGVICGTSSFDTRVGPTNPPAAWVSRPNRLALIPPLPGDTGVGASDINDHNEVVGESFTTAEGAFYVNGRAYLWQDGVASDLHMTLPGHLNSGPTALNDSTVIVGWSSSVRGSAPNAGKAVIWHDGTTRDLTAQIDASDPLKRYVKLFIATDINDAGEILAQGVDTRTGNVRAYFLRPMRLPNITP